MTLRMQPRKSSPEELAKSLTPYYANNPYFQPQLLGAGEDYLGRPEEYPFAANEIDDACTLLSYVCHGMSKASGWYHNPKTGERLPNRNVGEQFALMHSEISEALEADRKSEMDDKLPHRLGVEVELADLMIRAFDFAARQGLDLGNAIAEKMEYNPRRDDHKIANRATENGKAY